MFEACKYLSLVLIDLTEHKSYHDASIKAVKIQRVWFESNHSVIVQDRNGIQRLSIVKDDDQSADPHPLIQTSNSQKCRYKFVHDPNAFILPPVICFDLKVIDVKHGKIWFYVK